MTDKIKFRVHFNKGKQYFDVHVYDAPRKFYAVNKCWAYWQPYEHQRTRKGFFGTVALGEMDVALAEHELQHLWINWIRCRKPGRITNQNEERLVCLLDEIKHKFWMKWKKVKYGYTR